MKKTREANTGATNSSKAVLRVYRAQHVKINPHITKENVGMTALYRNARGVVVWAGDAK